MADLLDPTLPFRRPALEGWMAAWHRAIDDALRDLRRVAPERDPTRWAEALARLDGPLREHLAFEETVLMPAYRPLAHALPDNGAPEVLAREHAMIRSLLDQLALPVDSADGCLARGDALLGLAGLLEHHDRREQRYVVPTLADVSLPSSLPPAPAAEALALRPAPPPVFGDPDPLRAARLAVLQDGPLPRVEDLGGPNHPKAPRRRRAIAKALRQVEAATGLEARRDALAALDEALRLWSLIARV